MPPLHPSPVIPRAAGPWESPASWFVPGDCHVGAPHLLAMTSDTDTTPVPTHLLSFRASAHTGVGIP